MIIFELVIDEEEAGIRETMKSLSLFGTSSAHVFVRGMQSSFQEHHRENHPRGGRDNSKGGMSSTRHTLRPNHQISTS